MKTEITLTDFPDPLVIKWDNNCLVFEEEIKSPSLLTRTEVIQLRDFLNQLDLGGEGE